jgi:hypothetical protein
MITDEEINRIADAGSKISYPPKSEAEEELLRRYFAMLDPLTRDDLTRLAIEHRQRGVRLLTGWRGKNEDRP